MYDLFISYSRRNVRFINRLVGDLTDHGLEVWLDTIELDVGDSVHKSIERGINESRFFCLALSPHALDSYYVREIEFEQTFSRMVLEKRESYILPIVVQRVHTEVIPTRISHLYRLDFTHTRNYTKNVKQLVDKVRGTGREYTGSRWFKGLNISNLGQPVGVGPTSQKATLGGSYHLHWKAGVVFKVDVYDNGMLAHFKEFDFDSQGRVIVNKMYSPTGSGGWAIVEDVWYYTYDPVTGFRATKIMRYKGEATARVVYYDANGQAISEMVATDAGKVPDRHFPYSRKAFLYDDDGNPAGERWFDSEGREIRR